MLKDVNNFGRFIIIEEKGREVKITPKVVLEIEYEEIQASPTYSSGFAMRFPRISRLREEKSLDEINSLSDVNRLYNLQRNRLN